MSGELLAWYPTLDSASDGHLDGAEYTRKIEQMRQEAQLDPGSLGKILPSEEIVSGFREADRETQQCLADLIESLEGVGERVRAVRDHFNDVDLAVAELFTKMAGA